MENFKLQTSNFKLSKLINIKKKRKKKAFDIQTEVKSRAYSSIRNRD